MPLRDHLFDRDLQQLVANVSAGQTWAKAKAFLVDKVEPEVLDSFEDHVKERASGKVAHPPLVGGAQGMEEGAPPLDGLEAGGKVRGAGRRKKEE